MDKQKLSQSSQYIEIIGQTYPSKMMLKSKTYHMTLAGAWASNCEYSFERKNGLPNSINGYGFLNIGMP